MVDKIVQKVRMNTYGEFNNRCLLCRGLVKLTVVCRNIASDHTTIIPRDERTVKHAHPSAIGDWRHIIDVMGELSAFKFSEEELIALIGGAHSLGRCRLENSGFELARDEATDACLLVQNFQQAQKILN